MGALEEEIAAVEELISAYQSSCLPTNAFSHLVAINQPRTKRALPNLEAWFDRLTYGGRSRKTTRRSGVVSGSVQKVFTADEQART
jgi:hypothetical protein